MSKIILEPDKELDELTILDGIYDEPYKIDNRLEEIKIVGKGNIIQKYDIELFAGEKVAKKIYVELGNE